MRLFALSDIHTDYEENRQWTQQLSRCDFVDDVIVLAGDISDSIELIEDCFDQFCSRFQQVFFIPGNHDLWCSRQDFVSSVEKLKAIMALAANYGVTSERSVFQIQNKTVDLVPLYSWYDFSFAEPSSDLMRCWMDFVKCKWPEGMQSNQDICDYFLSQNEQVLMPSEHYTISFSHFVPRIDVMPAYIPAKHRMVYPVLGSEALDKQIRQLESSIHIYGHSHVNRDVRIDGVRYINNAFGYPSETYLEKKLISIFD